nr:hypothetical protein [Tanacetum cinerariifolium]
ELRDLLAGFLDKCTWEVEKLLLNQKCMGYSVRAYYSISSTKYYKDESCCNTNVKSKTTEDFISNRSFMEVLVLNHYVLVKNVLAFLVTADVPEIYMQEFWATAKLHHNSIRFKMDTKRAHLGHSDEIRYLTDVNVNKLYQPWRSFASVINKCLTGKSSGIDSFRLSQVQILWGFYHRINVDYAYLIWEDFVYQVEHKNQKMSNEMDDVLFSTIKVVSRHQTTQQYGTILSTELTTDEIRNSKAYKENYACATGEAAPKPKASARKKKGDSASSTTSPTPTLTTTVVSAPQLSATAKGKQPARATTPTEPTDVERTEA